MKITCFSLLLLLYSHMSDAQFFNYSSAPITVSGGTVTYDGYTKGSSAGSTTLTIHRTPTSQATFGVINIKVGGKTSITSVTVDNGGGAVAATKIGELYSSGIYNEDFYIAQYLYNNFAIADNTVVITVPATPYFINAEVITFIGATQTSGFVSDEATGGVDEVIVNPSGSIMVDNLLWVNSFAAVTATCGTNYGQTERVNEAITQAIGAQYYGAGMSTSATANSVNNNVNWTIPIYDEGGDNETISYHVWCGCSVNP